MITLIRHGESNANIDSSLYLHNVDAAITLTHKGVMASLALSEVLDTGSTSAIFVSPQMRAMQTAMILHGAVPIESALEITPTACYGLTELSNAVKWTEMKRFISEPFFIPSDNTENFRYAWGV